jgi:hypothetical protein
MGNASASSESLHYLITRGPPSRETVNSSPFLLFGILLLKYNKSICNLHISKTLFQLIRTDLSRIIMPLSKRFRQIFSTPPPPPWEQSAHSKGYPSRTPLESLYRMYEHIFCINNSSSLYSEIEFFFDHSVHSDWKVSEIPDPVDPEPTRYAIVSAIPHLLIEYVNRKGLPLETVPSWCAHVPRLHKVLIIHDSGRKRPTDHAPMFEAKNILWDPSDFYNCFSWSHISPAWRKIK